MYRAFSWLPPLALMLLLGCERSDRPTDVPTIDAFVGRLTHKGQTPSFPEGTEVKLKLISDKAISFGIPLKPGVTFDIGWMPIGKYTVQLTTRAPGKDGRPGPEKVYTVPGGMELVEGQTQYAIELGDGWKP